MARVRKLELEEYEDGNSFTCITGTLNQFRAIRVDESDEIKSVIRFDLIEDEDERLSKINAGGGFVNFTLKFSYFKCLN